MRGAREPRQRSLGGYKGALAIEDGRSGVPDQWKYKAKNNLMYGPVALPHKPSDDPDVVMGPPKLVVKENTRLVDTEQFQPGTQDKAMRAAPTKATHSYLLSPSPAPGVDDTPLMTWGEIEGTPLLLGGARAELGDATPGPKFSMEAMPKRDKVGLSLSRHAGKRLHEKKQKQRLGSVRQVVPTPSPSPHSRVALSPAAKRLLTKTPGGSFIRDASLRASYSATPKSKPGRPTSSLRSTPMGTPSRTPVRGPKQRSTAPSKATGPGKVAAEKATATGSSITDGLLDL